MSNGNKKDISTLTNIIDYFHADEKSSENNEEEEVEEEIYDNQKDEIKSLRMSGRFSRVYSYLDKKEDDQIDKEYNSNYYANNITNHNTTYNTNNNIFLSNNINMNMNNKSIKNNESQNKIFTTLYANEQPDSSFYCEEQKSKNKNDNSNLTDNNNNTEFFGRAVSFHPEDEEEINNIINEKEYTLRDNVNKGNDTNKNKEDNDGQKNHKKEIIDNNTKNNINNNINEPKQNLDNNNDNKNEQNNKNYSYNDNEINIINSNKDDNNNNDNIPTNKENNNINENDKNNISSENKEIKCDNNMTNDEINNLTNNLINNENKNVKNNGIMEDLDEKALEEKENEFLELERQRKEQEKIRKQREMLLEQLRIKEEGKKAEEEKLKKKKLKEKKKKELKESVNKESNNIKDNIKNDNNIEINNTNLNNNDLNNNNAYNYMNNNSENSKENNNIVNNSDNNSKRFDSFRNLNNFAYNNANSNQQQSISNNSNNNYSENPSISEQIPKNYNSNTQILDNKNNDSYPSNNNCNNNYRNEEPKKYMSERENQNMKILKNLINFGGDKKANKTKKLSKNQNKDNYICSNYNTYKSPVELTLYNDAVKRRKKLENIDKNVLKGIKLNSNKTKITNASYKVAIDHDEKIIEQTINKYSFLNKKNNTKSLDIIGIALSLRDIKIFRELFKEKNNINKKYTFSDLQKIILSVDKKETRKIKEINFLEQTWLLLNPYQNECINKDIMVGLLKIIFSPEGVLKEIESLLKKYLEAALIGANISNKSLIQNKNNNISTNKNKNKSNNDLICPITHKKITSMDIWPLSKYIKAFLDLKKNMIAYKNTLNMSRDKYSNLKHQKIQSNIDNNNISLDKIDNGCDNNKNKILKPQKKPYNFDKLYKKFLEKEHCKKMTLEQMRKKKEDDEIKELKEKPTITKYKTNLMNDEMNPNGKKRENIYDRLYKQDKEIRAKKLELIEEKERNEQEKIERELRCNKLNVNSRLSKIRMNKSFDEPKQLRGFDEYVKRNRKGRLERLRIKYLLEKNPVGEKYEEIRKRNITPPNITDIRRMRKNEYYRTMNYVNKTVNNNKELVLPENYLSEDESDGNTEYFNLQIKLPNGRTQTLKVYENDDANKVVEEFCKIHSVDDNIKNKLVNNIVNCQKQFLLKDNRNENQNDEDNEEEEEEEEDDEEEEENNIIEEENSQTTN